MESFWEIIICSGKAVHTREAAGFRSSFPAEELLREEQEESAGLVELRDVMPTVLERRESLSRTAWKV